MEFISFVLARNSCHLDVCELQASFAIDIQGKGLQLLDCGQGFAVKL